MPLVLSLFPGIGLLDMAFELEGFCVVRGPDVLWGGDVRRFHPPAGKFDGIIGGPPCQVFSRLAHMVRHNGLTPKFGNLIPEFERCVIEAAPRWFLMENVPDAPIPFGGFGGGPPTPDSYGTHPFLLNNRQCEAEDGESAEQNRVRRWTFGWRGGRKVLCPPITVFANPKFENAACGGGDTRPVSIAIGGSGKPKKTRRLNDAVGDNIKSARALQRLLRLQGLPEDFLKDAPFTVTGKCKAVGNGVPLPMGRAIAKAVREATSEAPE